MTRSKIPQSDGGEKQKARLLVLVARVLELPTGAPDAKVANLRVADATDLAPEYAQDCSRPVGERARSFGKALRVHARREFSSVGTIRTADGCCLDFALDLDRCEGLARQTAVATIGAAPLRDPLLIEFGGDAEDLSAKRFEFDFDLDGKIDSLSGLRRLRGYLAIGRAGAVSHHCAGDGFRARVKDGHGRRDARQAAAPSFPGGQVVAGGSGRSGQEGVDAVYQSFTETAFALTDAENRMLAQIRLNGLKRSESVGVKEPQRLDLAA